MKVLRVTKLIPKLTDYDEVDVVFATCFTLFILFLYIQPIHARPTQRSTKTHIDADKNTVHIYRM